MTAVYLGSLCGAKAGTVAGATIGTLVRGFGSGTVLGAAWGLGGGTFLGYLSGTVYTVVSIKIFIDRVKNRPKILQGKICFPYCPLPKRKK